MTKIPGGNIQATGLSLLVLNCEGRIERDYQFDPEANDASDLAASYLAIRNEADANERRRRIAKFWAPDGSHISATSVRKGRDAIAAEIADGLGACFGKGFVFGSAGRSQAHHGVAWLSWQMRAKASGEVTANGSNLLIFDESGLIRFDYEFDDRTQPHVSFE